MDDCGVAVRMVVVASAVRNDSSISCGIAM